jgi:hypothetical protein
MPRIYRRTKVISIRLSNEEYEQFQSLCVARGTDTISELTRTALKLLVVNEKSNGRAAIESRVENMDARMSQLDREVAHLANVMGVARLEGTKINDDYE